MSDTVRSDPSRPQSLPWIERLVAIDTVSRNSNLGLIETVRDYLEGEGFQSRLTHDAAGGKANLFASLPAVDGSVTGGIVLSGHTDVVPVDGQDWSSDPFKAEIRGDKLYGRGSADMKGFIGAALTAVPQMKAQALRAPIHFALSYDEELGCAGAPAMIDDLKARGFAPEGCIVGEPTGMQVVSAHKGAGCWRCRVVGRAAHSSLPQIGVNAIAYAAEMIRWIEAEAERFRTEGPFDDAYDTPYCTAQVGTISGGAATNIVPALCEFAVDHRTLPQVDPESLRIGLQAFAESELLPKMRVVAPEAAITFEKVAGFPGLMPDHDSEVARLARRLTGDNAVRKVAFGAEAGLFQQIGVPSVLCGPGHIAQAHKPDEFVELSQLVACETFLAGVIDHMRAK
jgi:acetylornithine deacetylase